MNPGVQEQGPPSELEPPGLPGGAGALGEELPRRSCSTDETQPEEQGGGGGEGPCLPPPPANLLPVPPTVQSYLEADGK